MTIELIHGTPGSYTNIAKIHKEIRQVAEYAYRHKNLVGTTGIKGRYNRVFLILKLRKSSRLLYLLSLSLTFESLLE